MLANQIDELFNKAPESYDHTDLETFQSFKEALNSGEARAAEPAPATDEPVHEPTPATDESATDEDDLRLRDLDVEQLRARYVEVVGRATSSRQLFVPRSNAAIGASARTRPPGDGAA